MKNIFDKDFIIHSEEFPIAILISATIEVWEEPEVLYYSDGSPGHPSDAGFSVKSVAPFMQVGYMKDSTFTALSTTVLDSYLESIVKDYIHELFDAEIQEHGCFHFIYE